MTRVRPSYWMSSSMALWAVVSALTVLSKNLTGLLLLHFFLGGVEAPHYSGELYLLSIFYTTKEITTHISILYTSNILATALAGLIALGIFEMRGVAGLPGWNGCSSSGASSHPSSPSPWFSPSRMTLSTFAGSRQRRKRLLTN